MIGRTLATAEFAGGSLVLDGGMGWLMFTALSLTAGTALVMWLGEQITERGVGNGISLIIFCGIVAGLPSVITNTYSKYNSAEMEVVQILLLLVIVVVITAGVVFIEQGARQVPIQYAKRQVGKRVYGGQTSHLPIRVNTAGVIPPIFASSLLQIPVTAAQVLEGSPAANVINTLFIPGGWAVQPCLSISNRVFRVFLHFDSV